MDKASQDMSRYVHHLANCSVHSPQMPTALLHASSLPQESHFTAFSAPQPSASAVCEAAASASASGSEAEVDCSERCRYCREVLGLNMASAEPLL